VTPTRLKRERLGWITYDFANTGFQVLMVTVLGSIFFTEYLAEKNPRADIWWGSANSLSMLIAAITAPILGAIADGSGRRKLFIFFGTALSVASLGAMWFLGEGMWRTGFLFIVLGNIGFQSALVFYNAFLPALAPPGERGRLSGQGFALGYLGALAALGIALPYARSRSAAGDTGLLKPAFLLGAVFYALFATPLFLWLRDRAGTGLDGNPIIVGFRRVGATMREVRKHANIVRFLVAYFIYFDAINTIIIFSARYARHTLGFSGEQVVLFFAMVQVTAAISCFYYGPATDRIGAKRVIYQTLSLLVVSCVLALVAVNPTVFYVAGVLAGLGFGAAMAASRALMAGLIPNGKEAEFFGFYGLCGKTAAVVGPFVFGYLSVATGSERYGIVFVIAMILLGLFILRGVREARTENR